MNYNNNIYIIAKYIFYNIYLANIDVIIKEIKENSIEVAKKLKAIGMDKYKIAKVTDLSVEEIDNFDVEVDYEYISAEEDNRKIDNAIKTQYTNEGKKEVAKNLKLIGLDISKIAQVTNLSIEEIENIYNLYKDMS